ncbi:MAG: hypothetical protein RL417_980 [Pseudomonadota bacterium]|jgi:KDO2-lipid IV(A) lauroyltransferase
MVRLALSILAALPLGLRQSIGYWGGSLFGALPTRDRRIAALQLERFLGAKDPERLARQAFAEAGRSALSALNLAPLLPKVRSADAAFIRDLKESARPVLALTAHLGPWDLLGAYAVAQGLAVATIGRAARSPVLHEALAALRAQYGITTFWRDDPKALRQIIEHFKAGGLIAALIDQDTRVNGTFSTFFGCPAFTPSSLIEIARRFNAAIVTAFIIRTEDGGYEVSVRPIAEGAPLENILAEYHTRLEDLVTRYPAQWVWFHKRWRTLSTGERLGSADYEHFLRDEIQRIHNTPTENRI